MSRRLFKVQEVNYINHIGAWNQPELPQDLATIANSCKLSRKETVTERTIQLLEQYIYWAPKRNWPGGEWEYYYNYAVARLERVKKILSNKEK